MLAALTVRDIVLIESAALEFAPGLNVLTGETGAGKSILLDALGLAAGGRGGGRAAVRPGAAQGSAVAVFEPAAKHASFALLREQDMAADGEIVLRRTLAADGRTRGFINDAPVGVALLKDLGALLLEIHGQADDRGLFDVSTHRVLLDAFGGHDALAADTASRFDDLDRARQAEAELKRLAAEAAADADYVRSAADELSALSPEKGEEVALASERALLMNASRIAEDVSAASDALSGERGAEASLAVALKRLSRIDPAARQAVAAAEGALEQAFAHTEEARREMDAFLSRLELDPNVLERKEERLFALRAAARKYNVPVDELAVLARRYEGDLALIDAGAERLAALEKEAQEVVARYRHAAEALSAARKRTAQKLDKAVNAELKPLKLERAQFTAQIEGEGEGPEGLERVEFWVRTNPGTRPGPLMKVASGGELARFLLALKVVLADRGSAPTLIFDEIDTGVGGATADAIGARLAQLSSGVQVIAVTHAPQVAARADRHYLISKDALAKGKRVATRVTELEAERRREEIARMLAGAEITAEARAAAERLIRAAG
jgi:DNA repair protein RecN (Recombination protein N)